MAIYIIMRIINKLTLSLFALTSAAFYVFGSYHLEFEAKEFRAQFEQETRLLAYSLLVSVENALRDRQTEDIRELLQQLERLEPAIDVRIYIRNRDVIRSDAESLAWPAEVERVLYRSAVAGKMKWIYYPASKPDLVAVSLPFIEHTTPLHGNLAIVRSLKMMNEELKTTQFNIFLSYLFFILFTCLLCLFLGQIYISRPLNKLRRAMRTFKNSTEPPKYIQVTGADELATLTREFNRMMAELYSANSKLDTETLQKRQLQRALQNADKMITIGQLSAGLAHEIGSPLQIVNGRARALANGGEDIKEVRRIAHILVEQTDRITRIVQRLLEFAPCHSSEAIRCDVIRVIAEVIDMLNFESRRRGITITFRHPDSLPMLLLNKDGLQQILLNLLSNALAAITGSGTISVELSPDSIVYAEKTIPALKLEVCDTGIGILEENLSRLFEPYFTTRGTSGGTGLGLAVVKTLVTEMGGSIVAESKLACGSRFTVHLPWNTAS